MRLIPRIQAFKATIIFIHGFRKAPQQWNYTETGHPILIEETLAKVANTVLIELNDDDYRRSITAVAEEMYQQLTPIIQTKIIVVTHSQGSFYGLRLAQNYPTVFGRLVLLEQCIKNQAYRDMLTGSNDDVQRAKLAHFDDLPTCECLKAAIIVRVHLNISSETSTAIIAELSKLTTKNAKSRLVVHYDGSHMIHYKIPHVVIDESRDMCRT